jgi:hypothetical protein
VTTAFPVGAAVASVTVAVEEAGPTRLAGLNETDDTALDTKRKCVVLSVAPTDEAESLTPVVCVTAALVGVKATLL